MKLALAFGKGASNPQRPSNSLTARPLLSYSPISSTVYQITLDLFWRQHRHSHACFLNSCSAKRKYRRRSTHPEVKLVLKVRRLWIAALAERYYVPRRVPVSWTSYQTHRDVRAHVWRLAAPGDGH